ncbi:MAG: NUDIX hydrolase [Nocardioidaceae bacterium]
MDRTRRLPPALVEHARAFLAGERTPAEPKPAATVVLLRPAVDAVPRVDGGAGVDVYLLRRHLDMPFAAGMYAFPGGTVDPRDSDRAVEWAGPSPGQWANRLACDEGQARALVCAAVRETFEESGVLLAGPTIDTVVADTTGAEWESDRAALVDHSLSFAELLDRRRLVIRTDLLAAWAHWITPEFEPRRYDTRFFVAALPAGQRARDVSGEADRVTWMRPDAAVRGVDTGDMAMLPPTYVTVQELASFGGVDEAIAAGAVRDLPIIVPGVEIVDGEGFLTVSDDVLP